MILTTITRSDNGHTLLSWKESKKVQIERDHTKSSYLTYMLDYKIGHGKDVQK